MCINVETYQDPDIILPLLKLVIIPKLLILLARKQGSAGRANASYFERRKIRFMIFISGENPKLQGYELIKCRASSMSQGTLSSQVNLSTKGIPFHPEVYSKEIENETPKLQALQGS